MRRTTPTEVKNYDEIYGFIAPGSLLSNEVPTGYARPWAAARPDTFA
jgi:hypothetical protein